ncbi:PREDICTED: pyruvate dehydrogenase phosphatase regulatory subunit, mitochondrial-like [Priapulus caudatus]|uniref:Pyruvate dehydrogenase phosphatase regulatory subunit, mitochondrial-like n=1 Tax=Priapulus caudatus TaxID=37621 RepID=A0ABM1E455_PRICU|nr:PREDICTED: pyruvate dehydrogenase phosphatase regulatory subunit, mitochondrial-like [Priapulus caudatus]
MRSMYLRRCRNVVRCRGFAIFRKSYSTGSTAPAYTSDLPTHAKVVICGGGVMGTSVAFQLAKLGLTDVVLLEKGRLSCGVTWMASGIVGCLRRAAERQLCQISVDLYRSLQDEGHDIGWMQSGSINLARTENRMVSLRRLVAQAKVQKLNCDFITTDEVKTMVPLMKVNDLKGAALVPGDGVVNPIKLCHTMATLAAEKGVTIIEKVKVEEVLTESKRVKGVRTSKGVINCEFFVNCAGQWARDLGLKSKDSVRVPVHSVEHAAVTTKPIPGMDTVSAVIRDYDGGIQFQPLAGGGLLIKGYESNARPVFTEGIPEDFEFRVLPEDWEGCGYLLRRLRYRFPNSDPQPALHMVNGPESFTPDGTWILGEAPEVDNYYVAAGFCDMGVAAAGGVGRALAERILGIEGRLMTDLWALEIQRFFEGHNIKAFLKDRIPEIVGRHYKITYPYNEYETGRGVRTSPLYPILYKNGGMFSTKMGYERPLWFSDDEGKRSATIAARHFSPFSSMRPRAAVVLGSRRGDKQTPVTMVPTAHVHVVSTQTHHSFDLARDDMSTTQTPSRQAAYSTDTSSNHAGLPNVSCIAMHVYHALMSTGRDYGMINAGYQAIRFLRIEKFHVSWGEDFDRWTTPIECGTAFRVKFQSKGAEVVNLLQYLCANDVDVPVGTIVHTGLLNHHGGYENDCSLVRMEENRYFMVSPTSQYTHAWEWITRHLPEDGSVQMSNVSSKYVVMNLIGPKSVDVLRLLSDANVDNFPYFTSQLINLGQSGGVKALHMTHSGEPGWTLYVPTEDSLSMRLSIEKFHVAWCAIFDRLRPQPDRCGHGVQESNSSSTVMTVDTDSGLGGKYVGLTRSTCYGFTLKRTVCIGAVHDFDPDTRNRRIFDVGFITDPAAKFEVEIAGKRFRAFPHVHPPRVPAIATELGTKYKYKPTVVTTSRTSSL